MVAAPDGPFDYYVRYAIGALNVELQRRYPKTNLGRGVLIKPLRETMDEVTDRFTLILLGAGLDTQEFPDARAVAAAVDRREPTLVFLDIPLESTEATECVLTFGRIGYRGHVQLMSNRG